MQYVIVETPNGVSIADHSEGADPQQTALENQGRFVAGPFESFDQAREVLSAESWLENENRDVMRQPMWFEGTGEDHRRPSGED